MAYEFNPDPWRRHSVYVDRTYPSGVAQERPKLTTRIHCEPEVEETMREAALSGPQKEKAMVEAEERARVIEEQEIIRAESCTEWFNRALRAGHAFRNEGDE